MLPYDKIPHERHAVVDLAAPLDGELGLLNLNLAVWMARDDSKADARAARAGDQVMDSIDAMLARLHLLRGWMVTERGEDAVIAMARSAALLEHPETGDGLAGRLVQAVPDHHPVYPLSPV